MTEYLRVLLPAVVAAIVTVAVTPIVGRLALRLRAVDVPGGRKRHGAWTPRLGGIAILTGVLVALGSGLLLLSSRSQQSLLSAEAAWIVLAGLLVFAVGVVDDIVGLRPAPKLLTQVLAASILVGVGWQFQAPPMPVAGLDLAAVAPIVSVLWIVGVTNAINFIDGLDGLAASIVGITASTFLILALLQRSPSTVIITSGIVGACIGFLRHNRPAKIHMGDSGALTLGFVLAAITVRPSTTAPPVAILAAILVLGVPVIDTLMVVCARLIRGHPEKNRFARVFEADRIHLHHLLLDGNSARPSIRIITWVTIVFCAMALAVTVSGSWRLGLVFVGVATTTVALLRRYGQRYPVRDEVEDRAFERPRGPMAAGDVPSFDSET